MIIQPSPMDAWERALSSPRGIKVYLRSSGHAINFRMQLYTARKRYKAQTTQIFTPGSVEHGVTPFDDFTVTIGHDEKGHFVMIVKKNLDDFVVEEL